MLPSDDYERHVYRVVWDFIASQRRKYPPPGAVEWAMAWGYHGA